MDLAHGEAADATNIEVGESDDSSSIGDLVPFYVVETGEVGIWDFAQKGDR